MIESVDPDLYGRALNEIYRLRCALAYEASVIVDHLMLKSFPKSRRHHAEEQVDRMRSAARGEYGSAYVMELDYRAIKAALREAGASETLTAAEFEAEAGE